MAPAIRDLAQEHGLNVSDLEGVVCHGGNGRMPAIVARQLGLPADKVWSISPETGNLGSVSLPAAWAARASEPAAPVAWTAVGAGLSVATALTGTVRKN
jgi:3-oxoacyl-[acyl-carrier-protein] synthase III